MNSVFHAFISQNDDDTKTFLKCCKDSELLQRKATGRFTASDVEDVFLQVKPAGADGITYAEFQVALQVIAEKKGVALAKIEASMKSAAPKMSTTKATVIQVKPQQHQLSNVYGDRPLVMRAAQTVVANMDGDAKRSFLPRLVTASSDTLHESALKKTRLTQPETAKKAMLHTACGKGNRVSPSSILSHVESPAGITHSSMPGPATGPARRAALLAVTSPAGRRHSIAGTCH